MNRYLINTASGNVLTGSTDKISVAPQQSEEDSQQWILDYNGKNEIINHKILSKFVFASL